MERKFGRLPALLLTAVLSGAAYFLRRRQLAGGPAALLLGLAVAAVLAFGLYAFFLEQRKTYASLCGCGVIPALVECLGAAGLGLGSLAAFMTPLRDGDSVLSVAGMAAALCWVASALFRASGRKTAWPLQLVPAAFFVVKLIVNFRLWSRDPLILDYCFALFALICAMCAALQVAGFSFDLGQRRLTVFFCLSGILFQAISLAGASKRDMAMSLGVLLWLLAQLWVLLRPGKVKTEV